MRFHVIDGLHILVGATIFIILLSAITVLSASSHPSVIGPSAMEVNPNFFEQLKDFLVTFPNSFCIGGIMVIMSILASYYSKTPSPSGEIMRVLGPLHGYIFLKSTILNRLFK